MSQQADWQPPRGVTAHDGTPLPPDLDFFADPPAEIGPVSSAYSSLKVGTSPGRQGIRATIVVASLLLGVGLGLVIPSKQGPVLGVIIAGSIGGFFGLIIALAVASNHRCHFVGRDGAAIFQWKSGPNPPGPTTVLVFNDATTLRTGHTDVYTNGVYSGTQYVFTWQRHPPAPPFKFQGSHRHKSGPFPTKDHVNFGFAAEKSWTSHKLARVKAEYERTGSVLFDLKKDDYVRLSTEGIEIQRKGSPTSIPAREIDTIALEKGVVVIRLKGAKAAGFVSKSRGIFQLPYSELADGKLFLLLASNLLRTRAS